MEIAITKMSTNGQVVIPAHIRKEANLDPATKFLIFNDGENIYLKKITQKALKEQARLMEKITRSEKQIKEGKSITITPNMSDEEAYEALMK